MCAVYVSARCVAKDVDVLKSHLGFAVWDTDDGAVELRPGNAYTVTSTGPSLMAARGTSRTQHLLLRSWNIVVAGVSSLLRINGMPDNISVSLSRN